MAKIIKSNLAFSGSLTPINKSRVDKLVQHHMAHKSWGLNDVHNFHKNTNGWAGIGYNYWIDFKGNVYEGRGMNVGAHVGGHNSHTIGVGYQGDFTSQTMPDAQLKAGIALNKWLIDQLPNVGKNDIIGHNDLASTACPGDNFRIKELVEGVGGKAVKPAKPSSGGSTSTTNWTKVTGSWTGQTLRNGQYGNPVKQLQTKLSNNNPPFYPNKGAKNNGIDSYYGNDTQDAVERFQGMNGLSVDGLAGKATYNKLNSNTSSSGSNKANLTVDGKWGNSTTRALQKALGTPVDGIISKQPSNSVTRAFYGNTIQFGSGASNVVIALQKKVGSNADGKLGPATIRALQKYLGTPQDGKLSRPSLVVKELQRRLNAGTF